MSGNVTLNSSGTSPPPSCEVFTDVFYGSVAFCSTRAVTVVPLSILVLHLTLQRRRRRRQHVFASTNHSDVFTFHVAVMELLWPLGLIFYFCGKYAEVLQMMKTGYGVSSIAFFGAKFFNVLTCVERYIAVVHPVTYLGLRKAGGVRLRNISIACCWLLCFGWMLFMAYDSSVLPIVLMLVLDVTVISFCCFSVLRVLIRPRVGEAAVAKQRVDPKKKRAFYIMLAVTVQLLLWLSDVLFSYVLEVFKLLTYAARCRVAHSVMWFSLPNSLVLPLQYLHRAREPPCSCRNK